MPEATARRAALKALLTAMTALGMLLTHPEPASAQPARPTTEATSPAPGPAPGHRILLLYGEPRLIPAIVTLDTILRSMLTDRSPVPVTFYTEYLDLNLFQGTVPLPELRELLRRKYQTRHIDLIVSGRQPRAPDRTPQPGGPLLERARRVPRRGPDGRRRPAPRVRRDRYLAPHGVGGHAHSGAPPAARDPAGRRGRRRLTDRPCLDGGSPQAARGARESDRGRLSHRPQPRRDRYACAGPAERDGRSWSGCSCAMRRDGTSLRRRP